MSDERKHWLDEPRNVNRIFHALCAVAAGLLVADLFYHRHAETRWDGWFAFYAVFGFVAYVFLVVTARGLRRLLMREEDYYDR